MSHGGGYGLLSAIAAYAGGVWIIVIKQRGATFGRLEGRFT